MTLYPHIIRLREPWQRTTLERGVRLQRSFNCPTGLDQREQVWLVIDSASSQGIVAINDQPLGRLTEGPPSGEFDLTEVLAPRNQICIDLEESESDGPLVGLGPVQLEIRLRENTDFRVSDTQ